MQTVRSEVTWSFLQVPQHSPGSGTPLSFLSLFCLHGFYPYPMSHPQTNCLFFGSAFSVAHTMKWSKGEDKWLYAFPRNECIPTFHLKLLVLNFLDFKNIMYECFPCMYIYMYVHHV